MTEAGERPPGTRQFTALGKPDGTGVVADLSAKTLTCLRESETPVRRPGRFSPLVPCGADN